jgi:hypothetical protein
MKTDVPEPEVGSVVLDRLGLAWQRHDWGWFPARSGVVWRSMNWDELVAQRGPVTLLAVSSS